MADNKDHIDRRRYCNAQISYRTRERVTWCKHRHCLERSNPPNRFFAFDLLFLNGESIAKLPLSPPFRFVSLGTNQLKQRLALFARCCSGNSRAKPS